MPFNLRKYSGQRYFNVENVGERHLKRTIADVREGKFDKLDLIFTTGEILSLNTTNNNTLLDAYGASSDNLIDKEIELYVGSIKFNGVDRDSVLVKPISPPDKQPIDMGDEIPF
jgi:hypothetical protein